MSAAENLLQASCLGMTEYFFRDEESLSVIYECRKLCVRCPLFSGCLQEGIEEFSTHPDETYGIMAGYPRSARLAMYEGRLSAYDWRKTWDPERFVVEGLLPPEKTCHTHNPVEGVCADCGTRVRVLARR